jgi:hypothetical protein
MVAAPQATAAAPRAVVATLVTFMLVTVAEAALDTDGRASARIQGLILVHFSAQLERILWDRGWA